MAKRQVIKVKGLSHGNNPIPVAVKIGNMLLTGNVTGADENGKVSADAAEQVAQAFANVRRILEAAGASVEDIAKLDVELKDLSLRELVNVEWVKMFPNEEDRPVRKTVQADPPGGRLIQLEMIAIVS